MKVRQLHTPPPKLNYVRSPNQQFFQIQRIG